MTPGDRIAQSPLSRRGVPRTTGKQRKTCFQAGQESGRGQYLHSGRG